MEFILFGAIIYILYLLNKRQESVSSTIAAIPNFTNNLPSILPTTSLLPNTSSPGISPNTGTNLNPDGTINVPGGIFIPPVKSGNEYYANGVLYNSDGNPVAYQFLPN